VPVDKSDLEAIKAAIVAAINKAGGVADSGPAGFGPDKDENKEKEAIARLEERIRLLDKQNESLQTQARNIERMVDAEKKAVAEEKLAIKTLEAKIDKTAADIELRKKLGQSLIENGVNLEELNVKREEELKGLLELEAAREKDIKKLKEQEAAYKSLKAQMSGMVSLYGKHSALNVGNAISMGKQIAKAGLWKTAQAGLIGIGIGLIDTIINLTLEIDKATSAMISQTGFTREQGNALMETRQEMIEFGVTVDDMSASIIALQPVFTDFTMLSIDLQTSIGYTGALLAKSGVGLETYGKGLQIATKSLGMGGREAMNAVIELDGLARQIGVAPKQMAADFASAGDMVSKFGSDGVSVFKDLAIVSKATGLSIEKLIRITENFDTFEGAAKQAGQLNAALGGNFVNAMDLLMATEPAERFGQIRDAILKTGKTFDSMSYFEKNFYVGAIDGIDNVTDLAMLMSGNIDDLAGSTNQSAQSLLDLQKRTEEQQNVMDRFTNSLRALIPDVTHFVTALHEVITEMKDGTAPTTELGKTLSSLAGFVKVVADNFKLLGFGMLLVFGAKMIAGIMLWSKQMGVTKVLMYGSGQAAAFSAKQLGAFGAAVLGIGAGIGLATFGMSYMVQSFKGLGDAAGPATIAIVGFTAAFGLLILGLIAIVAGPHAAAVAAGLGVLIGVGKAATMIGAGMGLAAAGIGHMAEGLAKMFDSIDIGKLTALAKFIVDVGGLNAIGSATGAGALTAIAASIYLVGEALESIPESAIKMLNSLSNINITANLTPLTADVEGVMDAIDGVSAVKLASTALIVTGASAAAATTNQRPVTAAAAPAPAAPNVEVYVTLDSEPIAVKTVEVFEKELGQSIRK